jgi:hypothetical protein
MPPAPKTSFFMHADKLLRFKAPTLPPEQVTWLAGVAITEMYERVVGGKNVADAPAKPYPNKRVYIPVTGKGRTKTGLKGRAVFTPKDLTAVKKAGVHKVVKAGTHEIPSTAQMVVAQRTRKSLKFSSRAEYKRFMGKPGHRALQESGRMLNAIGIVQQNAASVHIGFTREEEHQKALGNQKIDPWFGLSPANRAAVIEAFKSLTPAVLSKMQPVAVAS